MLSDDNEKLINEHINEIIENSDDSDNESFITELKLRIWSYVNNVFSNNVKLSDESINKLLSNIVDEKDFNKNMEYKWALNQIVDSKLCAKCGTCSVVCPNSIIGFDETPYLKEECLRRGNGMCQEVCPRMTTGQYEIRSRLNLNEEYYFGKSLHIKGQSGGYVTNFLKFLIRDKKIDGVVVVGDDNWKPVSLIITDEEGLNDTTRSKYSISSLQAVRTAGEMGLEKIAVVGLPCQVAGLRNIQYHPYLAKHDYERGRNGKPAKLPKIEYVIGLFCTEKFEHEELLRVLKEKNINIKDVVKFDVKGPNFVVKTDKKEFKIKLSEIKPSSGCMMCKDFDAELADISFGDKGSPEGYTTVITRTKKGEEIHKYFKLEKGVEVKDIDFLRKFKLKRFNKEVQRREDNNEFNSFYYLWKYPGVGCGQKGLAYIRFRANIGGYYNPDTVLKLAELTKKYDAIFKITTREEFEIEGIKFKDLEPLIEELKELDIANGSEGPNVRSIIACPGKERCLLGLINTVDLGQKLEDIYKEKPANYKFKIAVSGCPNKCVRTDVTEFGVNGVKFPITNDKCNGCGRCADVCKVDAIEVRGDTAITNYNLCYGCGKCIHACPNDSKDIKFKGYSVYIGGKSGRKSVIGNKIFVKNEDELLKTLNAVFYMYNKYAEKPQKERLADTMKRIGEIKFLNEVENYKNSL